MFLFRAWILDHVITEPRSCAGRKQGQPLLDQLMISRDSNDRRNNSTSFIIKPDTSSIPWPDSARLIKPRRSPLPAGRDCSAGSSLAGQGRKTPLDAILSACWVMPLPSPLSHHNNPSPSVSLLHPNSLSHRASYRSSACSIIAHPSRWRNGYLGGVRLNPPVQVVDLTRSKIPWGFS
jgi:hypothetical protein